MWCSLAQSRRARKSLKMPLAFTPPIDAHWSKSHVACNDFLPVAKLAQAYSARVDWLGRFGFGQEIFLPPARQRHASYRALWGEVRGDLDLCDVVCNPDCLARLSMACINNLGVPIGLGSFINCKFPYGSCGMTKCQIRLDASCP